MKKATQQPIYKAIDIQTAFDLLGHYDDERRELLLPENQQPYMAAINDALTGVTTYESLTYTQKVIYTRAARKQDADKLEADNKLKYAGITPKVSDKIEVGTILYASWGYDQTNVDFYCVVEVSNTMCKAIEMAGEYVATGDMTGRKIAKELDFTSEVYKKKIKGDYLQIDSSRYARLWDGKPKYTSSYC